MKKIIFLFLILPNISFSMESLTCSAKGNQHSYQILFNAEKSTAMVKIGEELADLGSLQCVESTKDKNWVAHCFSSDTADAGFNVNLYKYAQSENDVKAELYEVSFVGSKLIDVFSCKAN